MDARLAQLTLLLPVLLSLGANYSYRTENFIVTAATPELAREIGNAAETQRRELAIEWLGHELPPWQFQGHKEVCPIVARVSPQLGAGGVTKFMFHDGVPFGWEMEISGSRERVLDSVLPHEITHTIFATHFGRPLPRWADEGACTTVEHVSERSKQERFLLEFLTTQRGIAFNKMFAMKDYPPDILPLYSQGYSLARYLVAQGGKQKFVSYVGEGMRTNNWTAATNRYYGFASLSILQLTWLDWVRQGSQDLTLLASGNARPVAPEAPRPQDLAPVSTAPLQVATRQPAAGSFTSSPVTASVSRPVSEGWYARQRDESQLAPNEPETYPRAKKSTRPAPPPKAVQPTKPVVVTPVSASEPITSAQRQPFNQIPPGKVLIQWNRPSDQPWNPELASSRYGQLERNSVAPAAAPPPARRGNESFDAPVTTQGTKWR